MPTGMFTQNTHCQLNAWMSQPPTVGPRAGASIIGTPRTAIMRPRSVAGAMDIRMVMPTGMTMPPARPWMTRKPISDGRFQAAPQRPDAIVKARRVRR